MLKTSNVELAGRDL
jgi:hypothetical protein